MHTTQRGFIPLVAIVILGLVAVAGGTIATISIRSSGESPVAAQSEVATTTNDEAYSGPVSPQVESSEANESIAESKEPYSAVRTNTGTNSMVAISLKENTRETCSKAKDQDDRTGKGLMTGIHTLCDQLLGGSYTSENIRDKENEVQEKWLLWQTAEAEQRANEFVERDRQAQKSMEEALENPKPYVHTQYDSKQCLSDKKSMLPQIDAMYLKWFDEWQAERKELDSCYTTNSVPICDKKMTEINVEWQNKLTAQFQSFYDQLTQCSSGERRFSDLSSVVPSPY